MIIADDTIVALSTAAGRSARGVIRLSGPDAIRWVRELMIDEDHQGANASGSLAENDKTVSAQRTLAVFSLAEAATCPAEALFFYTPHSYTGQDVAELHLPGSPALLKMVLDRLIARGARQAQPGEFTARAFFNHRIDLSQAEAVAEMIHARSDGQLRAAGRLLGGSLHKACGQLANRLSRIVAEVEAGIDFSQEEDVNERVQPGRLVQQLIQIRNELNELIEISVSWEQLDLLPEVVIAGLANAGKSSLANALLQIDRSIVSTVAGTTRDVLTAPLQLEHGECLLIDTAGLGPVEDPLADLTQERARWKIETADLLLYVVDLSTLDPVDNLSYLKNINAGQNVLLVANKKDLVDDIELRLATLRRVGFSSIAVSATRGDHLTDLKAMIYKNLHDRPCDCPAEALALSARQRSALSAAAAGLAQALDLGPQAPADLPEIFVFHLREALNQLGIISGEIVDEDILDIIFSRFCIGK